MFNFLLLQINNTLDLSTIFPATLRAPFHPLNWWGERLKRISRCQNKIHMNCYLVFRRFWNKNSYNVLKRRVCSLDPLCGEVVSLYFFEVTRIIYLKNFHKLLDILNGNLCNYMTFDNLMEPLMLSEERK